MFPDMVVKMSNASDVSEAPPEFAFRVYPVPTRVTLISLYVATPEDAATGVVALSTPP